MNYSFEMSHRTYTRQDLLDLPIQMRKAHVMTTVTNTYLQPILAAARKGETSYLIELASPSLPSLGRNRGVVPQTMLFQEPWQAPLTNQEIQEALLEQFPGCKVTYEEKWMTTAPDRQELKKGILVDWS